VVEGGRHILANVIHSQVELHKDFGGVVPELAARDLSDLVQKYVPGSHLLTINDWKRARQAIDWYRGCPMNFGAEFAMMLSIVSGYSNAVVYVHCGMLSVGFRKKLGLPSHFDMRFSNPIDLHAVALSFPHLPFVIPHFGAGYFREALMVADMCPNIYFDTSSSNQWMKSQRRARNQAGRG